MVYVGLKLLITAGLIVLISEIAKRNALLGGFIAAMPLVTLFVLFWMYFEGVPEKKIGGRPNPLKLCKSMAQRWGWATMAKRKISLVTPTLSRAPPLSPHSPSPWLVAQAPLIISVWAFAVRQTQQNNTKPRPFFFLQSFVFKMACSGFLNNKTPS